MKRKRKGEKKNIENEMVKQTVKLKQKLKCG